LFPLFPFAITNFNNTSFQEHPQWCSVCDPAKIFPASKFSYLVFRNPTPMSETETANRWETTNSKPAGPIIMIGQSETWTSSQTIFIYSLLWQVHVFDVPSTSQSKLCIYAGPKPFCWAKPAFLTPLHRALLCRVTHRTAGDALTIAVRAVSLMSSSN